MKVKIISQYVGTSVHQDFISKLLKQKYTRFRILVAYVSISGINLIYEYVLNFIKAGGKLEWIVGIDDEITSKAELEKLLELQNMFPANVKIMLFS